MGNGTRHLLGAIAGIVAVPLVAALAFGGTSITARSYAQALLRSGELYISAAVLVVGAVLLGLLVGTRISPLASLIPGLVYSAVGAFGVVSPTAVARLTHDLPSARVSLGGNLGISAAQVITDPVFYGAYLLVGVLLLVASLPPSRWRAKVAPAAPGAHRAAPAPGEEPWPPAPPAPSDPAQQRATPPLPADEPTAAPEYPYGSGPQAPYGGAPPAGSAGTEPYGGAGADPQAPYRSAFEPASPSEAGGGEVPGYAPGYRPSSWSGPQAPYPADPAAQPPPPSGRPAQPAGADPYAAPTPPRSPQEPRSAFQPPEPWGPPPGGWHGEQPPPTRAFSTESDEAAQADPTPRTLPDANVNDPTHRIPWSEADQERFRDGPER